MKAKANKLNIRLGKTANDIFEMRLSQSIHSRRKEALEAAIIEVEHRLHELNNVMKHLREKLSLEQDIDAAQKRRVANIKNIETDMKQKSIFKCFHFRNEGGLGFFTIFGVGVHWKDTSRHRMFFSERNGYKKALTVGSWRLSVLNKN